VYNKTRYLYSINIIYILYYCNEKLGGQIYSFVCSTNSDYIQNNKLQLLVQKIKKTMSLILSHTESRKRFFSLTFFFFSLRSGFRIRFRIRLRVHVFRLIKCT